jgi:cytidylate kinase
VRFERTPAGKTEICIEGEPAGGEMKSQKIGDLASILAADPEIRRILLPIQRSILEKERFLIAEGRDMGTNVFYDADIKFFLTASIEVRATRRLRELVDMGFQHTLGDIVAQIKERDERDEKREVAPLRPADDAVIIDTSDMSIRRVVSEIMDVISPRVSEEQESELYETRFRG